MFQREISHAVGGIAIFDSEAVFKGSVGQDDIFKAHGSFNRRELVGVDLQKLKQSAKIFLAFKGDAAPRNVNNRTIF